MQTKEFEDSSDLDDDDDDSWLDNRDNNHNTQDFGRRISVEASGANQEDVWGAFVYESDGDLPQLTEAWCQGRASGYVRLQQEMKNYRDASYMWLHCG